MGQHRSNADNDGQLAMPDGSAPQRPTRIAILGSGIAGALAGIALNKLADVEIALFDQASELREVGASIGLQPCAMRCLDYLGLSDEIEQIGYRHGELDHTFRLWSTNEIIPSELRYPLPEYKHQMSRFARSDLHKLLISKLPPGSVHLKKKVVAVETPHDGDVRVSFADGTSWAGDGVVGADGIRSAVRQHFVPDYKLDHGHILSLREVFPRSLLDGIEDVPLGSCHYMGPDLGFFFSPINQDRVTIVAQIPLHLLPPSYANNADRHWAEPADVALLKTLYADWNPTIAAIAARTPAVRVYTDINGPALPSHVFGDGRVVLIGDAGHPHGGAHAAGGTMSVEDAYTLYRALDHVQKSTGARQGGRLDRAALRWAFKTFDTARIGHTTRVIDLANETRRKRQSNAGARVSDDVLRARVATRPDVTFLANNDTKAVIERVISENPFDEARNFTVKSQKAGN